MPEKLIFIFEGSKGALRGLLVYFVFHSKIKNNFTVGPMVTGETGDIVLTKQSVNEIITSNKSDFPMDYAGDLVDCELLSVIVESKLGLEDRVLRLKEFYPENAASLQEIVNTSTNDEASFCKEIELPTNEEIVRIIVTTGT